MSKALGHSNVSTTADNYSHWTRPIRDLTATAMAMAMAIESVLAPTGS